LGKRRRLTASSDSVNVSLTLSRPRILTWRIVPPC
jgi:hypothetical protein